jgi:hypothetical protein
LGPSLGAQGFFRGPSMTEKTAGVHVKHPEGVSDYLTVVCRNAELSLDRLRKLRAWTCRKKGALEEFVSESS